MRLFSPFIILIFAMALVCSHAHAQGINAELKPQSVPLGQSAMLSITVEGTTHFDIQPQDTTDMQFRYRGERRQMSYVNGKASSSLTRTYQVIPLKEGTLNIPSFSVMIRGNQYSTSPLSLQVSPGSGGTSTLPQASTPQQQQQGGPSPPPQKIPGLDNKEKNRVAFLRLVPVMEEAYVGEPVPVEVQAFFYANKRINVDSLPEIEGDAFIARPIEDRPVQKRVQFQDHFYNMLTWVTVLTPVKEGSYPVRARLDATLLERKQPSRRGGMLDPFGGSLLDQFFGMVEQQPFEVESSPITFKVKSLPEEDKPEDFTGAIGQFKMSATATPKSVSVGDPVTLRMKVSGIGDFGRVETPHLNAGSDDWKTYPASDQFQAAGDSEFSGEKIFEQVIIPTHDGIAEVPPITFSFFDTTTERYVTLRTKPLPITVTPGSMPHSTASTATSGTSTPSSGSGGGVQYGGLAPLHRHIGSLSATLQPHLRSPVFLGLQSLPLLTLFISLLLLWRQRSLLDDPASARRKAASKLVQEALKKMDAAMNRNDTPAFFHAAREAVQQELGEQWNVVPQSLTTRDLDGRLPEEAAGLRNVLEMADAVAYSGERSTLDEMQEWKESILYALDQCRRNEP